VYPNVHASSDLFGFQQLGQLGLSHTHRLVHDLAYQRQATVGPAEGMSFAAVPPLDELL
jgi:hypothetical protein